MNLYSAVKPEGQAHGCTLRRSLRFFSFRAEGKDIDNYFVNT